MSIQYFKRSPLTLVKKKTETDTFWTYWLELRRSSSFVCTSLCFFRERESLKHLPHCPHTKGFSPVCVLSCRCRFPAWLKRLLQQLHLKGFSPVCTLSWILRIPLPAQALPQVLHFRDFLLKWSDLWLLLFTAILVLSMAVIVTASLDHIKHKK